MKYVYAAVLTPAPEGYQVIVPDLPGCVTYGENLSEALDMAKDAIEMWLWDAENKKEAIPQASGIELISQKRPEDSIVNLIVADTDAYRRENDSRAVRKTVTIPAWLDYQAELFNAPFSQLLQEALKQYLGLEPKKRKKAMGALNA